MKIKHLKAYFSYRASGKKPIDFEKQLLEKAEKTKGTPQGLIFKEVERINKALKKENLKNKAAVMSSSQVLGKVISL